MRAMQMPPVSAGYSVNLKPSEGVSKPVQAVQVLTSLFAMNSINKFITFFGSVGLVGFGLTRLDSVFESMADRYEWRDA